MPVRSCDSVCSIEGLGANKGDISTYQRSYLVSIFFRLFTNISIQSRLFNDRRFVLQLADQRIHASVGY